MMAIYSSLKTPALICDETGERPRLKASPHGALPTRSEHDPPAQYLKKLIRIVGRFRLTCEVVERTP